MTPLKRCAAYAIDYLLMAPLTFFALTSIEGSMGESIPLAIRHSAGLLTAGISFAAPALILGVLTGLTGRTPGKLIMFLRVQDYAGNPPGLGPGIMREIVKAVSLGFFFGMIYALQAVVMNQRAFYDNWLDLDVEDLRPWGLTETQKNFRKYMREKQRRERR